jgi:6-phosphofructokinase 1
MESIKERILSLMASQSRSSIVVVAEGEDMGGAYRIAEALKQDPAFEPIDLRVCVLGHIQRGAPLGAGPRAREPPRGGGRGRPRWRGTRA